MMMLIYSITLLMKAMTVFGYEWLKKRTDLDVFTYDWYELKPPNEIYPSSRRCSTEKFPQLPDCSSVATPRKIPAFSFQYS